MSGEESLAGDSPPQAAGRGADLPHRNPLPARFLLEGEGVGGRLKERPEDFVVDELPLYQPSGQGEHLYVCVRKQGLSHHEAM